MRSQRSFSSIGGKSGLSRSETGSEKWAPNAEIIVLIALWLWRFHIQDELKASEADKAKDTVSPWQPDPAKRQ